MEQQMLWVTVIGMIVIPLVGWIFNSVITNKINGSDKRIDDLEKNQENQKDLFFRKLDEDRKNVEDHYVRLDLYQQNLKHSGESIKAAMEGFMTIFNAQFNQMKSDLAAINNKLEDKVKDLKDLEIKIDSMRELINNRLNNK